MANLMITVTNVKLLRLSFISLKTMQLLYCPDCNKLYTDRGRLHQHRKNFCNKTKR